MNYSRRSLASLYEKVRGKEVPPRGHLSVYGEAKITFEYDEGKPQTLEGISDKTAFRVADYVQGKAAGSFILKEDYKIIQKLAEKSGFETEDRFLKLLFQEFLLVLLKSKILSCEAMIQNQDIFLRIYLFQ